jgi:hypothetical protein
VGVLKSASVTRGNEGGKLLQTVTRSLMEAIGHDQPFSAMSVLFSKRRSGREGEEGTL